MLDQVDTLPDAELQLADMHMVGSYAIAPLWESGHSSGIYSFDYLRSICPCSVCRTAAP